MTKGHAIFERAKQTPPIDATLLYPALAGACCIAMAVCALADSAAIADVGPRMCALGTAACIVGFMARRAPRDPEGAGKRPFPAAVIACAAIAGVLAYAALAAWLGNGPSGALGAIASAGPQALACALIVYVALVGVLALAWSSMFAHSHMEAASRAYLEERKDMLPDKRAVARSSVARAFDDGGKPATGGQLVAAGIAFACILAIACGALLCIPRPASPMQADAAVLCALACFALAVASSAAIGRVYRSYETRLRVRTDEVDHNVDVAVARISAANAEHKAKEAVAAVREANQNARMAGMGASLGAACKIANGKYSLSIRESEVLPLLASGRTRKRISEELQISLSTVNTHIQNIYKKMNVRNVQELKDLLETLQ